MIGYVTFGTNDLERAVAFYDTIFEILGHERLMEDERSVAWGKFEGEAAGFCIMKPHDGEPATVGNGVMAAFSAETPQIVDRVHAKALELGGLDEGAPGPRQLPGFYAGYFRDLDGNKLNVFHMDLSKMGG